MERDPGELSESRNEEGMEAFLVALTAGFSHREFRIGPKGCAVGRDRASCDIVASGATVSRRHFAITVQDRSQILLEDLHSTNGVDVNGCRIPNITTLHDGDLIGIGTATEAHLGLQMESQRSRAFRLDLASRDQ